MKVVSIYTLYILTNLNLYKIVIYTIKLFALKKYNLSNLFFLFLFFFLVVGEQLIMLFTSFQHKPITKTKKIFNFMYVLLSIQEKCCANKGACYLSL
jgi:hypothetical protein